MWSIFAGAQDTFVAEKNPTIDHYFDDTKIEGVYKAKFDFKPQSELELGVKLAPLIMSHGFAGYSAARVGHLQELAS